MNAYRFIQATACIGHSRCESNVTSPVRVPDRIVRSILLPAESGASAPLDSLTRTEFVRTGLLTPGEAAAATFFYASL